MEFVLHPRLEADCRLLGDWPLSRVLLMNDAQYPWCILVPRCDGVMDMHHLSEADQQQLMAESCRLSRVMEQLFQPTKMNVAALGNVVPQLHVHHIARFDNDAAWPAPIWGKVPVVAYEAEALEAMVTRLQKALAL